MRCCENNLLANIIRYYFFWKQQTVGYDLEHAHMCWEEACELSVPSASPPAGLELPVGTDTVPWLQGVT